MYLSYISTAVSGTVGLHIYTVGPTCSVVLTFPYRHSKYYKDVGILIALKDQWMNFWSKRALSGKPNTED